MVDSPNDLDIESRQKELPDLPSPLRRQGHPSVMKPHIGSTAGIHQSHGVGQGEISLKKPAHRREPFLVRRLQRNLSSALTSQRRTRQLLRRRRHEADKSRRLGRRQPFGQTHID
jgi:hypothetical protein